MELGNWDAEHDESLVVAGYVFLFTKKGVTRFVRLSVDEFFNDTYDYGTYNPANAVNPFTKDGDTTGTIEPEPLTPNPGTGTAIINVPTSVANVGSCTAVSIMGPASVKGAKTVTISGHVEPEVLDTQVEITRQDLSTLVTNTQTDAAGNYSVQVPVRETTKIRATANGVDSQTRTITVRSTVKIRAVRLLNGKTRITGVTGPWLPGRVQLIKTTAFTPAASKQIAGGKFAFSPRRLSPGRWQVIYIPSAGRAARSISPAVRVR